MFTIKTNALNNKMLNEIFNNFSVFYIDKEDFDLDSNTSLKTNLSQSEAIIIQTTEEYQKDNIFLICFKNTIIIIKQLILKTLQKPIFDISKLPIFFLTNNSQNQFRKNVTIQDDLIKSDENFKDEIDSFNKSIKNILLHPTLSEYLIRESYAKINNDQRSIYNQVIENGLTTKSNKNKDVKIQEFDINDFIELRLIGIGTISEIFLSYHIKKRELFVIKKFKENDSEYLKLINREIENYQKIDFPLLPQFFGKIKGKNSFVIQFINGLTLKHIKKIKLNDDDKILIILELILIIEYFHNNHLVYRYLKPNNVIIDENKSIYVIDFDRMINIDIIDNKDENQSIDIGTEYAAPELNVGQITYKNDIYSLGKMIYYITKDTAEKEISIF